MGDMKQFRVLDWLLTDGQRDLRERWIQDIVKSISKTLEPLGDPDVEGGGGFDVGGSGGGGGGSAVSASLALVKAAN